MIGEFFAINAQILIGIHMHTVRLYCALVLSLVVATNAAATLRAPDFALLDHTGKFHQASYYSDYDAIVVLVESSKTLATERARSALSNIAALHQPDRVKVMLLSPAANELRQDIHMAMSEAGYQLPVLIDETQLVAQSLGLTRYGEVVVMDPETMAVLYQGDSTPIKKSSDFEDLAEIVAEGENSESAILTSFSD